MLEENKENVTLGQDPAVTESTPENNGAQAQETVNPYLQNQETFAQQEVPMQEETPVQNDTFAQQGAPMQQEAFAQNEAPKQQQNVYSQAIPAEPDKKQKNATGMVVILGLIAVVLLIAIIAVAAFAFLGNKKAKVGAAIASTFKESAAFMEEAWGAGQYEDMFKDEKITTEADLELPEGIGVTMSLMSNGEASAFEAEGSMGGSTVIEAEGYVDDATVAFAVPNMLDYLFIIDRENLDEDIWNLVDMELIEDEMAEQLIALNEGQTEEKVSEEAMEAFKEEITDVWKTFMDKTEMKSAESKKLMYDGKDRKCKGYVLITNEADVAIMVDEMLNVIEDNSEVAEYLEVLLEEDLDDMLDDLRDDLEDSMEEEDEEIEIEFYLYDGKLVQLYSENNSVEIEWNIEGGSFPLENTELIMENDDGSELEFVRYGEMDGTEYSAEYIMAIDGDEVVLDVSYDKESGECVLELLDNNDSVMYMEASMVKEDDDTLVMEIDTFEMEGEEIMTGEIVMINECDDLEMPEGDEFNLLTMSEEDLYDLVQEIYANFY